MCDAQFVESGEHGADSLIEIGDHVGEITGIALLSDHGFPIALLLATRRWLPGEMRQAGSIVGEQ